MSRHDPVDRDFDEHSREIDAEASRSRALEDLHDEIKRDPEELARLALLYAESHGERFLAWAAKLLLAERTPEHSRAWENEPC